MKVNETQLMSKDKFAKFMFTKGLETVCYNYDIVYDLKTVEEKTRTALLKSDYTTNNKPITISFVWYFKKDNGSWIFEEPQKTAEQNSDEEYQFTFTVNCDYLHKANFASIKRVR